MVVVAVALLLLLVVVVEEMYEDCDYDGEHDEDEGDCMELSCAGGDEGGEKDDDGEGGVEIVGDSHPIVYVDGGDDDRRMSAAIVVHVTVIGDAVGDCDDGDHGCEHLWKSTMLNTAM